MALETTQCHKQNKDSSQVLGAFSQNSQDLVFFVIVKKQDGLPILRKMREG